MVTGRRTVLSGWTTISTKTSFIKTSGELCKNLCEVSKVFRGVSDSDPGCPNEPEDLCYMDDFFFDPSLVERIFFQTFSEILTLKKTKKVFRFAGIKFNLTTSNAGCCCCYSFFVKGNEFLGLHYSNWERFLVEFFFTHSRLRFSRVSMSQYSKLKSNYARSRRRAKW